MLDAQTPVSERPEHAPHSWSHDFTEPSHDAIAKEAYALYAARGYQDGWHVEDWLAAEEALRHPSNSHER